MSVIPLSSISLAPIAVIEAGVSITVDDLFRAVTTISSISSEKTGNINKNEIKVTRTFELNIAIPFNDLMVQIYRKDRGNVKN